MATNPMQRKARNSFLGGMLLMLVITLVIGAGLYVFFTMQNKSGKDKRGIEKLVYVLNKDVKSGDAIDKSMVTMITAYSNLIPSNCIDTSYISKLQENDKTRQVIAKIDMTANTILTDKLITLSEDAITSDVRLVEYNMLTLPSTIKEGDYIDIRLTIPNAQDFIVISKEKIINLRGNTIGLYLSEEQILMMNNAIVEAYIMKASNLYAVQYVQAGIQTAATLTYSPTEEVKNLIVSDANIVAEAKNALLSRYDAGIREYINSEKNIYVNEQQENLEKGIKEQIEKAAKAREEYLTGLQSTNN